jgi:hypothetical protein
LYQTILSEASIYAILLKLDEELASEARQKGCRCGGRLHSARFPRKPRGVPNELDEAYSFRHSFCCSRAREGCRKRTTPPSFRFLSRRVYASVVVVLMTALRHGTTPARMAVLRQTVGVSRRTVERWRQWWLQDFAWKAARGRFAALLDLKTLPLSLLNAFREESEQKKTIALLHFLLPLTTTSALRET